MFGPQTGYFAPQLLMLQELQGPGISARGAAFAGLNLYVQLGRGQDYAWSATSAGQDITDTYAVPLCTTDGTAPTLARTHYLYRGSAWPMEVLEQHNAWTPDGRRLHRRRLVHAAAPTAPSYGLVTYRGTVGGKPVAFTSLRSTYRHEADSAIGFQMFNDPAAMGDAAAFQRRRVQRRLRVQLVLRQLRPRRRTSTPGSNPVRAAGADPNLPMQGRAGVRVAGLRPGRPTPPTYTPPAAHPQSVNQDYYVSWNNKQAKDYGAADGNFSFGSVHRGDLLDDRVKAARRGGRQVRPGRRSTRSWRRPAVTDLRGEEVLGDLLRVLDSQPVTDPALAAAVSQAAGLAAGRRPARWRPPPGSQGLPARRRDPDLRRLVAAAGRRREFKPGLGDDLYAALVDALQINESPSGGQHGGARPASRRSEAQAHKGSSFQYGWWGYVDKDLRAVLGDPVAGGLAGAAVLRQRQPGAPAGRRCCDTLEPGRRGAGRRRSTRATTPARPATSGAPTRSSSPPLGGITAPAIAWQNRPTYQQVVSFPQGRAAAR